MTAYPSSLCPPFFVSAPVLNAFDSLSYLTPFLEPLLLQFLKVGSYCISSSLLFSPVSPTVPVQTCKCVPGLCCHLPHHSFMSCPALYKSSSMLYTGVDLSSWLSLLYSKLAPHTHPEKSEYFLWQTHSFPNYFITSYNSPTASTTDFRHFLAFSLNVFMESLIVLSSRLVNCHWLNHWKVLITFKYTLYNVYYTVCINVHFMQMHVNDIMLWYSGHHS